MKKMKKHNKSYMNFIQIIHETQQKWNNTNLMVHEIRCLEPKGGISETSVPYLIHMSYSQTFKKKNQGEKKK